MDSRRTKVLLAVSLVGLYFVFVWGNFFHIGLPAFHSDVSSPSESGSPGPGNVIDGAASSTPEWTPKETKPEKAESEKELESTPEATPTPTPTPPSPSSPYDPTKLAFLVETRPIPHLPALFVHMMSVVPPEWHFLFMGSNESISHMRSSRVISQHETTGKLEMRLLPEKYSVTSRESISQMFTDPDLYSKDLAPAEHLLVFQPDSIFCVNSEQSLNDWLEWDWVGAPWGPTIQFGGNGGLSLRKVSRILEVLGKWKRRKGDGALEDLWLAQRLESLDGSRLPNATISKRFSVESVWDDRPMGYHVGWLGVHHEQIWDTEEQLNHIWRYCPEVKMILGMSLTQDKPPGVD